MATQKDAEILIQLLRWSNEMGADKSYAVIFSEEFDKERASAGDPDVMRILTYGEAVGTLVKHGLLDRALVLDFWAVGLIWDLVGRAGVKSREETGEPRMFENFEALAKPQTV